MDNHNNLLRLKDSDVKLVSAQTFFSVVFSYFLLYAQYDELNAKIHLVLPHSLVMLYNYININKRRAQLIYTSHDLSTINNEVSNKTEPSL